MSLKSELWTRPLSQADTSNQTCVGKNIFIFEQHTGILFTIPGELILSTGHSMIVLLEFINWFPDSVPAKYTQEVLFSTCSFASLDHALRQKYQQSHSQRPRQ